MARDELRYVETEGGPFILLPLELKKKWKGVGDEDEEDADADEEKPTDYDRAEAFLSKVGAVDVGDGQALILGTAEVTAFLPSSDGGIFVQRVFGDEDDEVLAAVRVAEKAKDWKETGVTLEVRGKGKLALFDSACAYEDADEDEVLKVSLAPGKYAVARRAVKTAAIELGLVRLRRS